MVGQNDASTSSTLMKEDKNYFEAIDVTILQCYLCRKIDK